MPPQTEGGGPTQELVLARVFGVFLLREIARRGLDQKRFAAQAGFSASAVSEWIRALKPIHLTSLERVLSSLDIGHGEALRVMAQIADELLADEKATPPKGVVRVQGRMRAYARAGARAEVLSGASATSPVAAGSLRRKAKGPRTSAPAGSPANPAEEEVRCADRKGG